ncbi:MAG: hypothetical protein C0505_07370 [Leptothrix sp. (in: Bacteria)]|nr:hypothetical protein [Leptothrix sp. (in: b-proteobacteria)]
MLPFGSGVEELAAAFEAAGAGIVITDARLHIVAVNGAYAQAIGRSSAELCGTPLPVDPACLSAAACPYEQEVTLRHRDGHDQPAWMRVDLLRDECGAPQRHVFTFTDISTLKREQSTWRHRAEHDALTGLPNRTLFDAELERCMARALRRRRAMALMFIDIDHFKRVNDHLGHGVGDVLLREFAQQLRQTLRAEDLVARLGGDEFVAVLEDLAEDDDASAAAASVLTAVTRCFEIERHTLHVTASIGIAIYPRDAGNAVQLMRAADAAMYLAKQQGRARFHHCSRTAADAD